MKLSDLKRFDLPDAPGVYFFKNNNPEKILYIGKATSLKSRVRSYFDDDILHTRGLHIANMVSDANSVEFQTTRSVLEALLLENELIKKHKPFYNTKEKDDKSYFVLAVTEEDFPRVLFFRKRSLDKLVENNEIKIRETFGPYPSGQHAKEALRVIRKIFPFRDKCEIFDKAKPYQKKPCFSYQIGLCPGVCAGVCSKKQYNKRIENLITFLKGDGEKVRLDLEKQMQEESKKLNFEEAQKIKETLFALEHVRDAHLLKSDIDTTDETRIEGYDVAHLSGTDRVGVMTVIQGRVPAKHEYKKFKLKIDKNDDLEGLREILTRRFSHLDWGIPEIIVVDGDDRHVRVADDVIKNAFENSENNHIQVVAVTKDKSHKAKKLTGPKEVIDNFQKEIVLVNSEAHRFSLKYHRELREKIIKKVKK